MNTAPSAATGRRPWRIGIRDGRKFGSIDRMVDSRTWRSPCLGDGTTFEASGRFTIFLIADRRERKQPCGRGGDGSEGDGRRRARNRHLRRRRDSRADAARGLSTDAGILDPVGRDVDDVHGNGIDRAHVINSAWRP